jgi:hypothetical protein
MRRTLTYIAFSVILLLSINILFRNYYQNKEFNSTINFKIRKIEITPALRSNLYNNKGEELTLNSYTFYSQHHLKIGDLIKKAKNQNKIYIYRNDSVILTLNPN